MAELEQEQSVRLLRKFVDLVKTASTFKIFIGFSFKVASLKMVQLSQRLADSVLLNQLSNMNDWQSRLQRSLNITPVRDRANAKAELFAFKPVSLHEPVFLLIEVKDFQGKAIEQFDQVRDRQMHLIKLLSAMIYTRLKHSIQRIEATGDSRSKQLSQNQEATHFSVVINPLGRQKLPPH